MSIGQRCRQTGKWNGEWGSPWLISGLGQNWKLDSVENGQDPGGVFVSGAPGQWPGTWGQSTGKATEILSGSQATLEGADSARGKANSWRDPTSIRLLIWGIGGQ